MKYWLILGLMLLLADPLRGAESVFIKSGSMARRIIAGTEVPATCAVGDVFFDTDATAGQNIYGCTSVNTWTLQSGGSFDEAGNFTLTGSWTFEGAVHLEDATLTGASIHTNSAGSLGAGNCTGPNHFHTNTAASSTLERCSANGGNPVDVTAGGDGYTQVQGNSGSAAPSGSSTLNVVGANNVTCVAADGSPDTVTCQLSISSQAQGDIIYYNGTTWVRLGPGTSGHFLKTNGAAANPAWAAAGGALSTLHTFRPQQNEPPAANACTQDTRNNHPVLDCDATTDEAIIFSDVMNRGYSAGAVTVNVHYSMTTAVAGDTPNSEVIWCAQFERIGDGQLDIDGDSFHTAVCSAATTVPATSGHVDVIALAFANQAAIDGIAAGEGYRLKIYRDADGTGEDAAGDAEFRFAEIQQ